MKTIISTIIAALITFSCYSQELLTLAKPADQAEWGYMNEKGEFIIEAKFRKCFGFSEGYAPIYEKKRKSNFFIDAEGNELKTEVDVFILKSAMGFGTYGFDDGMAPVKLGKKWGYLSIDGKLAIQAKYDNISRFEDGVAVVRIEKHFMLVNKSGEETEVDVPGVLDVKQFSEGLAPVKASNSLFGFIDRTGEQVIQAKFRAVGYFVDGLAWAKNSEGKAGYIDTTGEWMIKAQFDAVKHFSPGSGFARVKHNGVWTFVSSEGEITKMADADTFGDFSDGLAYGKKDGLVGFFNTKGEWVIKPTFQAVRGFKNGYAAAKKGDKWGFIDTKGEWAVEPTLDGVKDMELVN